MLDTLRLSFSLKNAYRVNGILYSLKQIPLLKHLLPDTLYQVRGLKLFANVLAALWELVTIFLFKFLYFYLMVCGLELVRPDLQSKEGFLQVLFFLTLMGAYMNTNLFDARRDKYYAIILLRMDARRYTLVNYGYFLLKVVVGFLPWVILFGLGRGVPLWLCLLIPWAVAGTKLAVDACSLWNYQENGRLRNDSKLKKGPWLLAALLLALAYLPLLGGMVLPLKVLGVLWVLCIPAGLAGLRRIIDYGQFREMNQELLSNLFTQMDKVQKAAKTASQKAISGDTSITSRKQGVEYFNELFIKRHRKILWRSSLRIAWICGILCCGILLLMAFEPWVKGEINQVVMTWLPYMTFILYMINRGTSFTTALFMNCDHSLLTYSFYKRPRFLLKLFQVRLREIIKINAVPALVIGVGLAVILFASGGTENPLDYGILVVSILAMSGFFSIHYLTVYYLLQPYTAGTEMKSGTYRLVMILTYAGCYALMNLRMPILVFGAGCIAFCLIYSIVASVLIYKYAPRTFRLRI